MKEIVILIDVTILVWLARSFYLKQRPEVKGYYWAALVAKVAAGIMVGVIYFYRYGAGDTIAYWEDGNQILQRMLSDPMGTFAFYWDESTQPAFAATLYYQTPRSLFFSKISGIAALLSAGNYWMMSVLLSGISFLCSWRMFVTVSKFFPSSTRASAMAFLFYPSVVFWSSGLIKESVGLACLFFLATVCISIANDKPVSGVEWMLTAFSLWVGWNLKYYWLGVFIPVAITSLAVIFVKRYKPEIARVELALWVGLFMVCLLIATNIHPNFYPKRFLEVIYQSNLEFMELTSPENAVHFYDLQPSAASVLGNLPRALVAGLFRPFVWEAHNIPSFLASMENLILLFVALTAVPALRRFPGSRFRLLTLAVLTYSLLLAAFLALSTPNFGTLSRYKIGFLPFLLFVMIYKNPFLKYWQDRTANPVGLGVE